MKCQLCGATGIEQQVQHANSIGHLQAELAALQAVAHRLGHDHPVSVPPTTEHPPGPAAAARALAYLAPGPLARTRLVALYKAKDRKALTLVAATWRCLRLIEAQQGQRRRA